MFSFNGKRVTVMGLGLHGGGVSVALWLVKHGALVTVTDTKTRGELLTSLRQISNLKFQIRFVLGRHQRQDFIDTDMVVRNPAVPVDSSFLNIARAHGVPIENEATLFFKHCKSKNIIGVTGTRGKSTTSAMISAILKEYLYAKRYTLNAKVWFAGNIRTTPMLSIVDRIKPDDWVVLELSSWHLEEMDPVRSRPARLAEAPAKRTNGSATGSVRDREGSQRTSVSNGAGTSGRPASNGVDRQKISPHIAVVTNVLEDHLNRYTNMRAYARAKETIVRHQKRGDIAVLNKENTWTRAMAKKTNAKVLWFPNSRDPVSVNLQRPGLRSFRILGEHNLMNAQAAAAVARALDIPVVAIRHALRSFRGLPDRLEYIRTVRGIRYYNDTTATTPDATIAALAALGRQGSAFRVQRLGIVLIAGGSDKKLDYKPLIPWMKKTCKAVVLLPGAATEKIKKLLYPVRYTLYAIEVRDMSSAVHTATRLATKGDIVLLSPAAASFGLFQHEFDRGEQFRKAVRQLEIRN